MTPPPAFLVAPADWLRDEPDIRSVRHAVFVTEQDVPPDLDLDGLDPECLHVLAREPDSRRPIGTGRLAPSGKIGRVAVLASHRRHGVGRAIVTALLDLASRSGRHPAPFLHAQVSSIPFYKSLGFNPSGPIFHEAGIPHRRMDHLPLPPPPS